MSFPSCPRCRGTGSIWVADRTVVSCPRCSGIGHLGFFAVFHMPGFTTRDDAVAMAQPHGLVLLNFARTAGRVRAMFSSPSREAIDAFSADLSYGPARVLPASQ